MIRFEEYNHVKHILFFDRPILSHYKKLERDYFLYFIDEEDGKDLLMFFEVGRDEILEYFLGEVSLHQLITESLFNIITFFQDQKTCIQSDFNVLSGSEVDEDFLPSEDSFLDYPHSESEVIDSELIPLVGDLPIIDSYIRERDEILLVHDNESSYERDLIEDEFDFNSISENIKHDRITILKELSKEILIPFVHSFDSFVKIDFEHHFETVITQKSKLRKTLRAIRDLVDYHGVQYKSGFIEIGLSSEEDIIKKFLNDMKVPIESEVNKKIVDWAETIGDKFVEDVINNDYSHEEVRKIISQYSEKERKEIFAPFFELVFKDNHTFKLKGAKNDGFEKIKSKYEFIVEKILPNLKNENTHDRDSDHRIVPIFAFSDQIILSSKVDTARKSSISVIPISNIELEKWDINIDEDVSFDINVKTYSSGYVLFTKYSGEKFEVKKDVSDKKALEDGQKELAKAVHEYILNTSDGETKKPS